MAKYTLELRQISESRNLRVFDFSYDFYDNELKSNFERKFIDHYFFNEIGFETIQRFKQRLKMRLNEIMPYYKQLYNTELASKDINFMLNKDLKETFIRDLNNKSNVVADSTNNVSGNDVTNFSESNINNGNARLTNDSLTTINKNNNDYRNNSESNNNMINTGNEREETTLISQGNIGITSSAELLQKWRDTIINIDQLIINECRDLFMQIF